MKVTKKELLEKIVALEKEIQDLKSRQPIVIHMCNCGICTPKTPVTPITPHIPLTIPVPTPNDIAPGWPLYPWGTICASDRPYQLL